MGVKLHTHPLKQSSFQRIMTFSLTAGVAFALRAYHVSDMPLWLDEIYGYQLGLNGIAAIIRNSLNDPHPPLGYLIGWASTGFGLLHSEWGMRWFSVVCGGLGVLLTFQIIRRYVDKYAAIMGCLIFATSPFHIFYSQEARSTTLIAAMAAVMIGLLVKIAEYPDRRRYWYAYVLGSLLGLYVSYSFALVTATQLLFLFFVLKLRRQTLLYGAALVLLSLPWAYFFVQSLPVISAQHADVNSNMLEFMQAMVGGEPVRYGFFWGHLVISILLGAAVLSALLDRRNYNRLFVYCVLQVLLPFILFWGILGPIMHTRLPLSEAKQFIIVLPAFIMLVCYGFNTWLRFFDHVSGRALVTIVVCVVVVTSVFSLTRYWMAGKSPEGNAILALRQQIQPDDGVVSLHYSLNAALSFYMTELTPFTNPDNNGNDFLFSHSTTVVRNAGPPLRTASVADIFKHARIWLLLDRRRSSEVANMFLRRCTTASQQYFEPFQIMLLNQCQ